MQVNSQFQLVPNWQFMISELVFEKGCSMEPTMPIEVLKTKIQPDWIDYNGHMTESRYLYLMSLGSDAFLEMIGMDMAYVKTGRSYYSVETHILNYAEGKLGEPVTIKLQLLDWSKKKLHIFQTIMHSESEIVLATGEQVLVHVNIAENKVVDADPEIIEKLEPIAKKQLSLPKPATAGRFVGQGR